MHTSLRQNLRILLEEGRVFDYLSDYCEFSGDYYCFEGICMVVCRNFGLLCFRVQGAIDDPVCGFLDLAYEEDLQEDAE